MNRGDVVELDWPFSDRTGSKTRPAIVYLSDRIMRQIEACLKTVLQLP